MLVGWVLFPVVLGLLSIGCGLTLAHVSGRPLRGTLVMPGGLAVLILVAHPFVLSDATAELAVPAVVAVAAAGFVLALRGSRPRMDVWAAATALGAFAVYAAPVVLSGRVAVAGYIKLDDSASWLGIADHLGRHGTSEAGLAPSTYQAMLHFYLGGHYPIGGLLPLTVGDRLLGSDGFELYQPFIAFLAAMLALCIYAIAERSIATRWLRAAAAFVAAQAALLYGYGLWGGSKELATALLIALVAALFEPLAREQAGARRLLPLAAAAAALLSVTSVGGGVWLVGFLVPALAIARRRFGRRGVLRRLGVLAALVVVLAIPSLLSAGFLGSSAAPLTQTSDRTGLANLIQPLSPLQALGIWPVGDFRLRPSDMAATYLLLALAGLAVALGLRTGWRARVWTSLAYAGASALGALIVVVVGTAWIDAKAWAVLSPALVLTAMIGVAALAPRRRALAVVVGLVLAGGVIWSNLLGYHDVQLTPAARFAELQRIGREIRGHGPTLMTDFDPFATRLFLRDADPEGASELRRRLDPLRAGRTLQTGQAADIDAFQLASVLDYRTLVLRRSPYGSRPPSNYQLVRGGRFYDVWSRGPGRVAEHLPMPRGPAPCGLVRRVAQAGARVAFAPAPPAAPQLPLAARRFTVGAPGRYEVWVGGAFRGRVSIRVDGRAVAARDDELAYGAPFTSFARVRLAAGEHRLEVVHSTSVLRPGSGGGRFAPRSIVIAPVRTIDRYATVPAAAARTLCGRRLDWVEALP